MPSNPTPGAGNPQVLAAGQSSAWFDCRPYAGHDLPIIVIIAGNGVASLRGSNDRGQTKAADVYEIEQIPASIAKAILAPLPSFLQIVNVAGVGTVTFNVGMGVNAAGQPCQVCPQSTDQQRTGDFSA